MLRISRYLSNVPTRKNAALNFSAFDEIAFDISHHIDSFSTTQLIDMVQNLTNYKYATPESQETLSKTLKAIGREVHPLMYHGLLSPFEITKLAKNYAKLKYPHNTFFRACSQTATQHWAQFKAAVAAGEKQFEDDLEPFNEKSTSLGEKLFRYGTLGMVSTVTDELRRYHYFDEKIASPHYELGFGLNDSSKVGQLMLTEEWMCASPELNFARQKELQDSKLHNTSFNLGQLATIIDSMLQLNISDWNDTLYPVVLDRLSIKNSVASLDSAQCLSCIIAISRLSRGNTFYLVQMERLCDRFLHFFFSQQTADTQVALFLKELAYYASFRRKYRLKTKPQTRFETKRLSLKFLLEEIENENRELVTPISSIAVNIINGVETYSVKSLCCITQSLAFLGLEEEGFFQAIIAHLKERVSEMTCEDIQRLEQGLNRAKVDDRQLFWKMGLQHQKLQGMKNEVHIKHRSELVKRVG